MINSALIEEREQHLKNMVCEGEKWAEKTWPSRFPNVPDDGFMRNIPVTSAIGGNPNWHAHNFQAPASTSTQRVSPTSVIPAPLSAPMLPISQGLSLPQIYPYFDQMECRDANASAAVLGWPYSQLYYSYDPMIGPVSGYGADMTTGRRKNATRETTSTLKAWLKEHKKNPYPTKGEKIMLAIISKMTLTQVSTWFANARRRLKKENKMMWNKVGVDAQRKDDDTDSDVDIDKPEDEKTKPRLEEGSPSKQEEKPKIWSIVDTVRTSGEEVSCNGVKGTKRGRSESPSIEEPRQKIRPDPPPLTPVAERSSEIIPNRGVTSDETSSPSSDNS